MVLGYTLILLIFHKGLRRSDTENHTRDLLAKYVCKKYYSKLSPLIKGRNCRTRANRTQIIRQHKRPFKDYVIGGRVFPSPKTPIY